MRLSLSIAVPPLKGTPRPISRITQNSKGAVNGDLSILLSLAGDALRELLCCKLRKRSLRHFLNTLAHPHLRGHLTLHPYPPWVHRLKIIKIQAYPLPKYAPIDDIIRRYRAQRHVFVHNSSVLHLGVSADHCYCRLHSRVCIACCKRLHQWPPLVRIFAKQIEHQCHPYVTSGESSISN